MSDAFLPTTLLQAQPYLQHLHYMALQSLAQQHGLEHVEQRMAALEATQPASGAAGTGAPERCAQRGPNQQLPRQQHGADTLVPQMQPPAAPDLQSERMERRLTKLESVAIQQNEQQSAELAAVGGAEQVSRMNGGNSCCTAELHTSANTADGPVVDASCVGRKTQSSPDLWTTVFGADVTSAHERVDADLTPLAAKAERAASWKHVRDEGPIAESLTQHSSTTAAAAIMEGDASGQGRSSRPHSSEPVHANVPSPVVRFQQALAAQEASNHSMSTLQLARLQVQAQEHAAGLTVAPQAHISSRRSAGQSTAESVHTCLQTAGSNIAAELVVPSHLQQSAGSSQASQRQRTKQQKVEDIALASEAVLRQEAVLQRVGKVQARAAGRGQERVLQADLLVRPLAFIFVCGCGRLTIVTCANASVVD